VIWRWRWRAGSAAHQALMGRLPLEHLDHLDDMIARPDAHIEAMMVPFRRQRACWPPYRGSGGDRSDDRLAASLAVRE
jgi:hypothetical protein